MPLLQTPRLDLVPATVAHLRAEIEGCDALARSLGAGVPLSWPPPLYDADAIRFALNWLVEHPSDAERGFAFYYFVLRGTAGASPLLIGAGGFKGAPDAAGIVEVGYSVLAEHQRQGYATEAVVGWVDFAFASSEVTAVMAQTLASLGPSIRVLEKAGFRFAGAGADPDAPPGEEVVRYEMSRADYATRCPGSRTN
ncbi:MAG: GNAT family N-acetyltransferase [Vicinamibacterales bacterium]